MKSQTLKMLEFFNKTIESECDYNGSHDNIDYFSIFTKAGVHETIFTIFGLEVAMLNTKFENEDAVLMIFRISSKENNEEGEKQQKTKSISEKIINLVQKLEKVFITLDFIYCDFVKPEAIEYVTVIKKSNLEREVSL